MYIVYAASSDILRQSSFAHNSRPLQKRPDSALRIWGPKISCLLSFVSGEAQAWLWSSGNSGNASQRTFTEHFLGVTHCVKAQGEQVN